MQGTLLLCRRVSINRHKRVNTIANSRMQLPVRNGPGIPCIVSTKNNAMKKYLSLLIALACAFLSNAQDPAYPGTPAVLQNITAAEYFIDTDPGIGNATAISVAAAVNISNVTPAINVTGLSNGVHHQIGRASCRERV